MTLHINDGRTGYTVEITAKEDYSGRSTRHDTKAFLIMVMNRLDRLAELEDKEEDPCQIGAACRAAVKDLEKALDGKKSRT